MAAVSLSERPSKNENLFKGIIVLTVSPSCDRSALARIPRFVALPSVTVVSSESRYQNWFFATLLEKSSEKSSRFLMNMDIVRFLMNMDIVRLVQFFSRWIQFQTFDQWKRTVDRSRLGVSTNVGSICFSFKLKIDAEISVVPVIKIVPVSYSEFVARLCLKFVIPREGERGTCLNWFERMKYSLGMVDFWIC